MSHIESAGSHFEVGSLATESIDLLRSLAALDEMAAFYLAGSAALALRLGHRNVRSVDLMSSQQRLAGPERRLLLERLRAMDPGLMVETARDGYFYCRPSAPSPNGTALKMFFYPYPVTTEPCRLLSGLAVASLEDLGLMKLAAIISRGTRRDFVDLYHLAIRIPLTELLDAAPAKFPHVRDFPLQALKALACVDQIGPEPMPSLDPSSSWSLVTSWTLNQVRSLGRTYVGLDGMKTLPTTNLSATTGPESEN